MATTWNDEEYARVAIALLYPGHRPTFLPVGVSVLVFQLVRKLSAALEQLPEIVKGRVLDLCGEIEALERDLSGVDSSIAGLQDPSVLRVDKITLDPTAGLRIRAEQVARVRARLVGLVGVPVNPESDLSGSSEAGGINASIC